MIGQELHGDEVRLEDKTFAPGYGEFHSGQGSTFEATALAVPTDALSQPTPAGLVKLYGDATSTFEEARSGNWGGATASQSDMNAAWDAVRATQPPTMLADQMTGALAALAPAVGARDPRAASLAALDVARASLDLELRYRAPVQVDAARFDLWTRQLQVDAAAGAQAGAIGDATTLQWIRDRIGLAGDGALRIDAQLRTLEAMVESGELPAASGAAARLRESLAALLPA